MDISSVISGRDAPEVFELVEAALDTISEPIGFDVMADDGNPSALGGDHGLCAQVGDEAAKSIAVVTSVGNDSASGFSFEQGMRLCEIVCLTGRENEPERPAERIGQQMDFGCQSSSGAPQSLIFGPPFPVAACWCARTRLVSSIRYSLRRSLVSTENMRSQTPAFAHRVKRLCTLFHLPY